jgi:hypothetical protein
MFMTTQTTSNRPFFTVSRVRQKKIYTTYSFLSLKCVHIFLAEPVYIYIYIYIYIYMTIGTTRTDYHT